MSVPKAWIDEETNHIVYREDIDPAEIDEISEMVTQAFHAGILSGYKQGLTKSAA